MAVNVREDQVLEWVYLVDELLSKHGLAIY